MTVRVRQLAGEQWSDTTYSVSNFCSRKSRAQNELMQVQENTIKFQKLMDTSFFNSNEHKIDGDIKQHITRCYNIPESYWTLLYLRSNGFALCERIVDDAGNEVGLSIYFRFLIKHVEHSAGGEAYSWDEMTFLLYLGSDGTLTSFLIDLPLALQDKIVAMYPTEVNSGPLETMGSFLQSLIGEVIVMYDEAVWKMRHVIRRIEKERSKDFQFSEIHNQARHAIHISEVLQVAVTTVQTLQECIGTAPNLTLPPTTNNTGYHQGSKFNPKIQTALHMLKNVNLRSRAIEKRFLNEINLAFNLVSQKDSIAMKEMSSAMRKDSHAMRGIAVLTLSFLPATFVSTIFGMGFFSTTIDNNTGEGQWAVAREFWIYWVIAIPLTLLTLTLWKFRSPTEPSIASKTVDPPEWSQRAGTIREKMTSLPV